MLWYGFIFYFLMYMYMYLYMFFFFSVFFKNFLNKMNLFDYFFKMVFFLLLFMLFVSLFLIYFIFIFYTNFFYLSNKNMNFLIFDTFNFNFFFFFNSLNINFMEMYYFPFMYMFLLITMLSIIFCLSYNLNELLVFLLYCFTMLMAGYVLFFTDSMVIFFLSYEMLLVPSFFILYKFAKTKSSMEAAYLMFFWTQFGALFLIFSFLYLFFLCETSSFWMINDFYFSKFEVNFLFLCWMMGFGVKLPIWPFYGWLPKAHVEASTNFSIFLSGVLVKFAFFGLLKCLFLLQLEPTFVYIYPFLVIGIVDSVFKLFYQMDLKKLVAYSTVLEMHWLTFCIISGQSPLFLSGFCMLMSHALLSTNSFFLVDAINSRFKTSLMTEISGINFLCPKLFLTILINSLVFLGFPGSIFFMAEFLFFSFFFDIFPLLTLFLIIFLYLLGPTFFFSNWMNTMFGLSLNIYRNPKLDLNKKEFVIFNGLMFLMFWLGFSWQFFIF